MTSSPRRSTLDGVPSDLKASLAAVWAHDVPIEAIALYGRWWQLETWLRDLVYLELKARWGRKWLGKLPSHAEKRVDKDRHHAYMATPDAHDRLAYLDVAPLFRIIEQHWDIFEYAMIDREVWLGRVPERLKIRHQIGHCRRPHPDDLSRLEQTLRDLDRAAFHAVAAFNRQFSPQSDLADPVVESWVRGDHEDARRLITHSEDQYDVRIDVRYSCRPWGRAHGDSAISGREGYIWHVSWYLGRGSLDLRGFWNDSRLDNYRELIIFACSNDPLSVEVSFAAVDDPAVIADAIGGIFEALLYHQNRHLVTWPDDWDIWRLQNRDLDFRLQIGTAWAIRDDTTPTTMFGA